MKGIIRKHQNNVSDPISTVPKRDVILVLPSLRFQSEVINAVSTLVLVSSMASLTLS